MKITFMGHASFRIEIGGEVLLIDPWVDGNPLLSAEQAEEALQGATQILMTHGHFDHATGVAALSKARGIPVSGMPELTKLMEDDGAVIGGGYNIGGTMRFDGVEAALVPALHSNSYKQGGDLRYAGREIGYVLKGEGVKIYISGDTGIMADMDWIGRYYEPDIGILCCGGHYTMDMKQAAWAAREYFDFKKVIPCHFKTFPLLEQDCQALRDGLPGVEVVELEVMESLDG